MQVRRSFHFPRPASVLRSLITVFTLSACAWYASAQASPSAVIARPSGGSVTLAGHTVPQVANGIATRIGQYDEQNKLRLVLAVQRPHPEEEEQFLRDLQTKGNPNFHHFLTAEEWNARFSPSVEDEQKVVDWAKSQGLTVTNRFANRLLVDVEAPVSTIEKAFNITINNYQLGDEVDFANDRDPSIPASLSGVLHGIAGLNSIQRFERATAGGGRLKKSLDYVPGNVYSVGPSSHSDGNPAKKPNGQTSRKTSAASTPSPSITNNYADPGDIFSSQAYDYNALYALGHCCNAVGNSGGSPPESSIALMTYGNFSGSDVNSFFQYYGMAWNWTPYYIDGSSFPGQDDEAPLDVEYSTASANSFGAYQNTAAVYIYEATNTLYSTYQDTFNFIVSDGHAKVVSTSYGFSEAGFENGNGTGEFDTMHGIFNSMVGQGFTLIAAAGDQGSTQDCTDAVRVLYPASDYDFVAAGGTALSLYSDGTYAGETAWTGGTYSTACAKNNGGGGGGISSYFGQPSWQSGLNSNTSKRLMPDISLNAGGIGENYYYNGALVPVGGTSIVAPELAGFFAQENSYLDAIGNVCGSGSSACAPLGNPSPAIYEAAKYSNVQHYPFYDITSGCNSNNITAEYGLPYYCAGTGYDLATGWGSANMLQLAYAINWEIIPAYGMPYITFSGPATNTWYNTNQTVSWTIHDYQPAGTYPGTGIAGETQGWDGLPADPGSEATPGSGNSFYSGPQYPNGSTGCLALQPNGCAGGVSQGCHYAYARGWNNQGWSTANNASSYPEYYGPICYDTVAPTIGVSNSRAVPPSGWYTSGISVTLSAADPGAGTTGSGLAGIYYGYGSCSTGSIGNCAVYGSPIGISAQGITTLTAFSKDVAGNFSSVATDVVRIDSVAPATSATLSGTLVSGIYQSAVSITLSATDAASGVATTYYTLDGGSKTVYGGVIHVTSVGSHTLTYWSVDVAGNTEATHTQTFTVDSPTTTTLTSSPNPSVQGKAVVLTVTVTPLLSGSFSGTVNFYVGTTSLGSRTLSGGTATLTTTTLPLGDADKITATYAGTTYFLSSTASITQTVSQTTTTTLTSTANPSVYDKPVSFKATVTPGTSGNPSGSVQFLDGTTVLGSASIASGVATYSTTTLSGGTHSITAIYNGSPAFATSTSGKLIQTVTPAASQVAVKASANPSTWGQSVTLTATVTSSSGTPTGTVTFQANGKNLATETISGNTATFSTSTLPVGNNSIVAVYNGSDDFATSTSPAAPVLTKSTTTTALTATPNPSPSAGTSVTLTATVHALSGGPATGTVTFSYGSTKLSTVDLVSGVATLNTTALPVGTDSLTASYVGATNFLPSTSPAISEKVQ